MIAATPRHPSWPHNYNDRPSARLFLDKGFIRTAALVAGFAQPPFVLHGARCNSFANRHDFIDWILSQNTPVYLKPTTTMQGTLVFRISPSATRFTFETSCPQAHQTLAAFAQLSSLRKKLLTTITTVAGQQGLLHPIQSLLNYALHHLASCRGLTRKEATCLINQILNTPPQDQRRPCDWIAEHDIAPNRAPLDRNVEISYVFANQNQRPILCGRYGKVACGGAVAGNLARGAQPTKTELAFKLALPRITSADRARIRADLEAKLPGAVNAFANAVLEVAPNLKQREHPLDGRAFRIDLRFPTNAPENASPKLVECQVDLPSAPLGVRGLAETDPGAFNQVQHLLARRCMIEPDTDAYFGG